MKKLIFILILLLLPQSLLAAWQDRQCVVFQTCNWVFANNTSGTVNIVDTTSYDDQAGSWSKTSHSGTMTDRYGCNCEPGCNYGNRLWYWDGDAWIPQQNHFWYNTSGVRMPPTVYDTWLAQISAAGFDDVLDHTVDIDTEYPNGCGDLPQCADADGDDIPDELDPTPLHPEPFQWRIWATQGDPVTWTGIEFDEGSQHSIGTWDDEAYTSLNIGAAWQDFESYKAAVGTCSTGYSGSFSDPSTIYSSATIGGDLPSVSGLNSGVDNTGNSTEIDYLSDIVTNTQAVAENQQSSVDREQAMVESLEAIKAVLAVGGSNTNVVNKLSDIENGITDLNESLSMTEEEADQGLADFDSGSTDAADQGQLTLQNEINSIRDTAPLDESLFDDISNSFQDLFPTPGACQPLVIDMSFIGISDLTIDCTWSDLFKSIFSWFLAIYTIFEIINILINTTPKEV